MFNKEIEKNTELFITILVNEKFIGCYYDIHVLNFPSSMEKIIHVFGKYFAKLPHKPGKMNLFIRIPVPWKLCYAYSIKLIQLL